MRGAKLPPTFDVTLTHRPSGVRNWTTGNGPFVPSPPPSYFVIHYVTDHTLPVPANALDLPTFIPRSEKETHTAQ